MKNYKNSKHYLIDRSIKYKVEKKVALARKPYFKENIL